MISSTNTPVALTHYIPYDEGLAALKSGKINWISPNRNKDPFLSISDMDLSFTENKLLDEALHQIANMVFARNPPVSNLSHPVIKAIVRWRLEERFNTEDEIHESLRSMVSDMARPQFQSSLAMLRDWLRYLQRTRILELSDTTDNMELWRYKADNHRGLAIRFRCQSEDEHPCMAANPIPMQYGTKRLPITTVQEQARLIFCSPEDAKLPSNQARFTCRPKFDAARKEWVALCELDELIQKSELAQENLEQDFIDEDVVSVFIGAGLNEGQKGTIKRLLKRQYQSSRIFEGSISETEFELSFKQVHG